MVIYGFDPGTKFGWSVFAHGELVASGFWKTREGPKEHPGRRFQRARKQLLHLFTQHPPTPDSIVGYEDIHVSVFRDKSNLRVYTGLVAQLWEAAAVAGIEDIRGIVPATLKKHATGSGKTRGPGRVSKEMVIDACIKRFGVAPASDDESDAIWVGHYFTENTCPPPPKKPKRKKRAKSTSTSQTGKPRTR